MAPESSVPSSSVGRVTLLGWLQELMALALRSPSALDRPCPCNLFHRREEGRLVRPRDLCAFAPPPGRSPPAVPTFV